MRILSHQNTLKHTDRLSYISKDTSVKIYPTKGCKNVFTRALTLIVIACMSLLFSTNLKAQESLGYKGSVELGYTYLANSDVKESWRSAPFVTTTHGYQFKPWLYFGIGFSAQMFTSEPIELLFPVHADLRLSLPIQQKCKPYFDLRVARDVSWRVYPSVGYRVPVYKDRAMLFSVGLNVWTKYFEFKEKDALLGLCVRIGYEW